MTISTIGYGTEIEDWRQEIETTLRRDWVSLAGRFELTPGLSRIGADPASEIVLPAGAAPNHVGDLRFENGAVTLTVAPEVVVFTNGAPVEGTVTLRSDAAGTPDIVTINALTFFIIQRGPRTIVRIRDANNPTLQRFGGGAGSQWTRPTMLRACLLPTIRPSRSRLPTSLATPARKRVQAR